MSFEDYGIWLIGGLAALIVVLAVYAIIQESNQWEKFAASHNCKVVGKTKAHSDPGYGMTANGKMGMVITTTPETTGYLCDDGVTYWR